MLPRGDELKNVIASFAEIEWSRCGPVLDDPRIDQFYITHMTIWRYKEPHHQLEQHIKEAVESFEGRLAWQMTHYGRNWIIAPAEHNITDFKKRSHDPIKEIGIASNTDLMNLATHIKGYVEGFYQAGRS